MGKRGGGAVVGAAPGEGEGEWEAVEEEGEVGGSGESGGEMVLACWGWS